MDDEIDKHVAFLCTVLVLVLVPVLRFGINPNRTSFHMDGVLGINFLVVLLPLITVILSLVNKVLMVRIMADQSGLGKVRPTKVKTELRCNARRKNRALKIY